MNTSKGVTPEEINSGIPEYDDLLNKYQKGELTVFQLASHLWNKAYIMGGREAYASTREAVREEDVDNFLRMCPEYRCLDVIGKFKDYLNNQQLK